MPILNMIAQGSGGGGGGSNVGEPSNLSAIVTSNSSIDIKWTDNNLQALPPSTFQKSVLVRKVGSAPTTPSDGTTVVTETVMNTYQNTAYTDTGLTDGTTYYYQVFSYSTDGGITYGTPVSATPQSGGWQPGVNTTLYLPLDGDITDPYNQVTYSWVGTSSFTTWSSGVQAANLTGSNAIDLGMSKDFEQGTGEMTVLFWFTTNSPSSNQRCEFRNVTEYYIGLQIDNSKLCFLCKNSLNENWYSGTTTLTSGTKYLATLTMKENGQAKLYLNGNLEYSINIGTFGTYPFQDGQYIGSGRLGDSEFWVGMIKDFIIENKEWSAAEVSSYYSETRANYGL